MNSIERMEYLVCTDTQKGNKDQLPLVLAELQHSGKGLHGLLP